MSKSPRLSDLLRTTGISNFRNRGMVLDRSFNHLALYCDCMREKLLPNISLQNENYNDDPLGSARKCLCLPANASRSPLMRAHQADLSVTRMGKATYQQQAIVRIVTWCINASMPKRRMTGRRKRGRGSLGFRPTEATSGSSRAKPRPEQGSIAGYHSLDQDRINIAN